MTTPTAPTEPAGPAATTALATEAGQALEAARALAGRPWDEVAGADAVAAVEAITRARSLLDAALLRGVTRLEETGAGHDLGWASTNDFLTHLTGGHRGTGGGLVRAARQVRDLPAVQTALETGRITLPQARAIAGQVHTLPRTPEPPDGTPSFRTAVAGTMLDLVAAHGHDATALQQAFADVVRTHDPDAAIIDADRARVRTERAAHHARYLSLAEDGRGGVRIKGYGSVEDAEIIKTALFPLAAPVTTDPGACGGSRRPPGAPLFDENGLSTQVRCPTPGCGHDGRDPREPGTRLYDAFIDVCTRLTRFAATGDLPSDHGIRPRVVALIDHASLRQQVIDAGLARPGETNTGAQLSASALRRIACDADLVPAVLGTGSHVLDVGRTRRLVTPALWTALVVRDRHCSFPGCPRMPLACDAHHVVHWADGGPTELDNLVLLCRHHHTQTHHSPWTVRIDPGTHRPVWTPPPPSTRGGLRGRVTYRPAAAPPPPAPRPSGSAAPDAAPRGPSGPGRASRRRRAPRRTRAG
jgi:hypothetical protein